MELAPFGLRPMVAGVSQGHVPPPLWMRTAMSGRTIAVLPALYYGDFNPNGIWNGALESSADPCLGAGASLGITSNAPRIHGRIRQKSAYVPAGRSGGVEETPVGLPSEIGS